MSRFVARSTRSDALLCTDGETHAPMFVGPGGFTPKTWKTRAGAERSQKAFIEAGMREVLELQEDGSLPG